MKKNRKTDADASAAAKALADKSEMRPYPQSPMQPVQNGAPSGRALPAIEAQTKGGVS